VTGALAVPLTGTRPLLRATLRYDGRRFVPWVLLATLLPASSAAVYPRTFPTPAARGALAAGVGSNPALGLVLGPADDLATVDGFTVWRGLALGGLLVALGAVLAVVRTTRGQEDSGQAELLASGVLGRAARLVTGVALALLGSLAAGVVAGVVTGLCGASWPVALLLGATFTASGWVLAAVAAVAAQLSADGRTATTLAVGTLGVLFLARGLSSSLDLPAWTLWANPLGWVQLTRPATDGRWWPLLPAVALTVAGVAAAAALESRRDLGQGVLTPGPGPARGTTRSGWRLAVRLDAGVLVTWACASALLGLALGYLTTSVDDLLHGNAVVRSLLAAGATDPGELTAAFVRTVVSLVGILASVAGVQVVLRVRAEELAGRLEPVLATAVSRTRYLAGHVVLALTATGGALLVAGAAIALVAGQAGTGVSSAGVLRQALATVPAGWAVVAVAVAVVGTRPAAAALAWAGVLVAFLLTLLGPTLGLDDAVLAASPFWHVPTVAGVGPAAGAWTGLAVVGVVTGALLGVGFTGFRRRDVGR
jgi:ABC-2 type transport system permease protein